jgi:hypothetical protein
MDGDLQLRVNEGYYGNAKWNEMGYIERTPYLSKRRWRWRIWRRWRLEEDLWSFR